MSGVFWNGVEFESHDGSAVLVCILIICIFFIVEVILSRSRKRSIIKSTKLLPLKPNQNKNLRIIDNLQGRVKILSSPIMRIKETVNVCVCVCVNGEWRFRRLHLVALSITFNHPCPFFPSLSSITLLLFPYTSLYQPVSPTYSSSSSLYSSHPTPFSPTPPFPFSPTHHPLPSTQVTPLPSGSSLPPTHSSSPFPLTRSHPTGSSRPLSSAFQTRAYFSLLEIETNRLEGWRARACENGRGRCVSGHRFYFPLREPNGKETRPSVYLF